MSVSHHSRRPALLPLAALLAFVVIAAAGCGPAAMLKAVVPAQRRRLFPPPPPSSFVPPRYELDGAALPLAVDQQALADLYDAIAPSVVNIQVEQSGDAASGLNPFNLPDLPNMPDMPQLPDIPQMPQGGQGTGWVYDTAGHLVTNNHVVDGAEKVTVTFANGLWADAEVVAADPQSDLAVIKVKAPAGVDLRPLPLATNDDLRVGYTVIAIGTPFGLESTMTTGIVSALGRGYPVGDAAGGNYTLPDVIQTDAAINPGNSGGPLLNLNGEVVGINFAIESPVRASSGIGFAIPVSIVRRVIPALINDGVYHYPYLGIGGQTVTPQLAEALELKGSLVGAYVESVSDGGPAAKAGVRGGNRPTGQDDQSPRAGGDIITAIDGQPVQQFEDLVSYLITQTEPGQKVTLTVLRDGKTREVEVTLGERPATQPGQAQSPSGEIDARAAIDIARKAVSEQKLLRREITETVATEGERDGRPVWVVELSDGRQTATVVVDAETGEVIETAVR